MMITASPLARFSPASIADSLPKLRLKETYLASGSCAEIFFNSSRVPSLEPSSTKTSSTSSAIPAVSARTTSWNLAKTASSLKHGTTRDRRMGSPVMDVDCGARLPEHAATDGISTEDACELRDGCDRPPRGTRVPRTLCNERVTGLNALASAAS